MSFTIDDGDRRIDLGPTFDVLKELAELQKAGFTRAHDVIASEGEQMPLGTQEEARRLLDSQPGVSPGAMIVLRLLAGVTADEAHSLWVAESSADEALDDSAERD